MQETTELKVRLEKERTELETRLRQQIDQQQQRASDLDSQVHYTIIYIQDFWFESVLLLEKLLYKYSIQNQ